jgi:hypothetical protein
MLKWARWPLLSWWRRLEKESLHGRGRRGRLILTSSYLSSLPIYSMRFYLLPMGTHRWMDSVRARFFWRGAGKEVKYHMMKWHAVCRPKDLGGLGIINTWVLNECLMIKWIWKLYS